MMKSKKPSIDHDFSEEEFFRLAAESEDLPHLKESLAKGADVNECDPYGKSALLLAVEGNFFLGVQLLIESGADLDRDGVTALQSAISKDNVKIAQLLASKGVSICATNPDGWTSLGCAALLSSPETLLWVLSQKPAINECDPHGTTPLIHAAVSGSLEKVNILLEAGADPDIKDSHGHNARDWAEINKFKDVAKALVSRP